MFAYTVTRPASRRKLVHRETLADCSTPEHMFDRLIEETEELRRLCGFDRSLFRATELLQKA